jgi:putative ABC transport system permease protein
LFIVLVGVIAGLFMAIASGRLLASLMFANSGMDTSVYIVVAVMLVMIAMLASLLPAYKATKVDPNDALRHD